jgi:hypothetical protein
LKGRLGLLSRRQPQTRQPGQLATELGRRRVTVCVTARRRDERTRGGKEEEEEEEASFAIAIVVVVTSISVSVEADGFKCEIPPTTKSNHMGKLSLKNKF